MIKNLGKPFSLFSSSVQVFPSLKALQASCLLLQWCWLLAVVLGARKNWTPLSILSPSILLSASNDSLSFPLTHIKIAGSRHVVHLYVASDNRVEGEQSGARKIPDDFSVRFDWEWGLIVGVNYHRQQNSGRYRGHAPPAIWSFHNGVIVSFSMLIYDFVRIVCVWLVNKWT